MFGKPWPFKMQSYINHTVDDNDDHEEEEELSQSSNAKRMLLRRTYKSERPCACAVKHAETFSEALALQNAIVYKSYG